MDDVKPLFPKRGRNLHSGQHEHEFSVGVTHGRGGDMNFDGCQTIFAPAKIHNIKQTVLPIFFYNLGEIQNEKQP